MIRRAVAWTGPCVLCVLWASSIASSQESADQADALALLAKIDGKATFDPVHPKRVIAIDI